MSSSFRVESSLSVVRKSKYMSHITYNTRRNEERYERENEKGMNFPLRPFPKHLTNPHPPFRHQHNNSHHMEWKKFCLKIWFVEEEVTVTAMRVWGDEEMMIMVLIMAIMSLSVVNRGNVYSWLLFWYDDNRTYDLYERNFQRIVVEWTDVVGYEIASNAHRKRQFRVGEFYLLSLEFGTTCEFSICPLWDVFLDSAREFSVCN